MMNIDGEFYYTPAEATEVLRKKSGRAISQDYVRQLVRYGKLHPYKVNDRLSVYPCVEVESLRVASRGGKQKQDRAGRPVPRRAQKKNGALSSQVLTPLPCLLPELKLL